MCDTVLGPLPPHASNNRIFRYLFEGAGKNLEETVENNFTIEELKSSFVVRDEANAGYRVFASSKKFWDWMYKLPKEEKCLHEVIFGTMTQRLKFDIDMMSDQIDMLPTSIFQLIKHQKVPTGDACVIDAHLNQEMESFIDELLNDMPVSSDVPKIADIPADTSADTPADTSADTSADTPAIPVISAFEERSEKVVAIINFLLETILDELYIQYFTVGEHIGATRKDLIVTDSCGMVKEKGVYKYSFHVIIIPYGVINNDEAKGFTASVINRLPVVLRQFIDPQVNKSVQNFRITNCSKLGSDRVKKVTTKYETAAARPEDTLIRVPGIRKLTPIYTTVEKNATQGDTVSELTDEDIKMVLTAIKSTIKGHTLRTHQNGLLLFDRNMPTKCYLCEEVHHRDNTLMIMIEQVEGKGGPWSHPYEKVPHQLIERCRHKPKNSRVVGEVLISPLTKKGTPKPRPRKAKKTAPAGSDSTVKGRPNFLEYHINKIRDGHVDVHMSSKSSFESLPPTQQTTYSLPQMNEYHNVATLAVKAQMKLGKTRQLRVLLDQHYRPSKLKKQIIRFVTFRQTFSNSLKDVFPDFILYSDHKGNLDHIRYPRLIVQVESLHRLPMPLAPEPIDLLVLDEVESILAQFNSGLHNHFNTAWAMFEWMLRTAHHVICMDANIGNRTYRVLERIRSGHPIHFHWNRYQKAQDDEVYFTTNQATWLESLHRLIAEGQKIVIPSNSLAEAETLEEELTECFPDKAVRLYSGKTLASEKAEHFSNVHQYWAKLDILIYTPTLSAGVSFELEHFDALFGYFTDQSCNVETCRQMLARVRNLSTRKFFICLRGMGNNLPTDIGTLTRLIHDRRAGLYRKLSDIGLSFQYSPNGEIHFFQSSYFDLWIQTTIVDNLSQNDFIRRFINQVADTGAKVFYHCPPPKSSLESKNMEVLKIQHRETKKELRRGTHQAIAIAENLTIDEASLIRNRLSSRLDVTIDLRMAYIKFTLSQFYSWHERPMTAEWVARYNPSAPRAVYKNLIQITKRSTILKSLISIQNDEAGFHQYLLRSKSELTNFVNECKDLQKKYTYNNHKYAIWFITLCGYKCITDQALIREETLENRLRGSEPRIINELDAIGLEFKFRKPNPKIWRHIITRKNYVKEVLKVINFVLRRTYGIEIRCTKKSAGASDYYLRQTSIGRLFIFSHEPDPKDVYPHIPSNLLPVGRSLSDLIGNFIEAIYYEQIPDENDQGA